MLTTGQYFPISVPKILLCINVVVQEWEQLGMALQMPYEILREIDTDKALVASKKEEMIVKWMDSPGPACWWLLVKALEEIDQNVVAAAIRTEQGIYTLKLSISMHASSLNIQPGTIWFMLLFPYQCFKQ